MLVAAHFMLIAQEIYAAMGITAQDVVLRVSGILLAASYEFVFDGLAASGILAPKRLPAEADTAEDGLI